MIEYEVVKLMWRSSKKDLVPTFATFILCLVIGVEYGIVAGVGINLIFLLYPSARPQVHVEKYYVSRDISRIQRATERAVRTRSWLKPPNSRFTD